MSQANIAYVSMAEDGAGAPLSLSIFADRAALRGHMRDDAEAAGFRITEAEPVDALLAGAARALGEVVLIDCPQADGAVLAALSRLDLRAAHCGARLVVSTSVAALDDVFACLDQSNPQILVDPTRAERVMALGRVLARLPRLRLRELSEADRMMMLRLTEQVGQIAERLERLAEQAPTRDAGPSRFEAPRAGFRHGNGGVPGARMARPPLPDPRLLRRIIRQRQLRGRFFDDNLFADPAWDMLLDLTVARAEHTRVSVTSLCIASAVPPTTALRWIGQMIEAELFERIDDETDRRRAFIALTDKAADAMARYFADLGEEAARSV